MRYKVDTRLLAWLVRAKRTSQDLREAAVEITKSVGLVSVDTLLRVEQQRVPDQKTDATISCYTRLDDSIEYNAGRSLGL